jgi:TATA-box binding protein (TBP) (component of TFIID and TFIIIB)
VRQLAVEAGVFLRVARFECINIVGAMNLQATLNCAAFAQAHKSSAHYDKSSFVGLAFRPPGEKCVVEIYSSGTGRRVS